MLVSDIDEIVNRLVPLYDYLKDKHIILTGAQGFLGRYFCQVFSKLNDLGLNIKVEALDNFVISTTSEPKNIGNGISFIKKDITESYNPEESPDYIIFAAGIASPFYYKKYPLATIKIVTEGLKQFLDIAEQHNSRLLFFSSSEIYGDPEVSAIPTSEDYPGRVSCTGPRACYDESKRLGETLVKIYSDNGVRGVIVRPFNVYGPGMMKTDYRVLPNFANQIFSDNPVQIYGNGNQTRTFCYVSDAIVGFLQCLIYGKSGESYNIGNPTPEISMIDLTNIIEKVLGHSIEKELSEYPDTYPSNEPNRRCPNIKKAMTDFEYKPQVDIETGLERFLKWAKENYV